jgi:hypothetical protein
MNNEATFPLYESFQNCAGWIRHCCTTYEIDPYWVAAVCWKESGFDVWAVRYESGYYERYCAGLTDAQIHREVPGIISPATDRRLRACSFGPMQIMGGTARHMGYSRVHLTQLCSEEGVRLGVIYFSSLLHRYGDMDHALSAYNAGSPTDQNRESYVNVVHGHYEDLKKYQVFVN